MKRLWIGIAVLTLLLAMGIVVSLAFRSIHLPTAQLLSQAGQAAMDGDWEQAEGLRQQAQQRWERGRKFSAAFSDHAPMDEIEGLFAQLEIYARARQQTHFSALCAQLSQRTEAITDSHRFQWWTVL